MWSKIYVRIVGVDMKNEKLTALITGASYGIGYEFARILAETGYNLILVSRSEEKLIKVKDELEKNEIEITIIPLDLSRSDSAEILYNRCKKNNLNVDILINNAGVGLYGKVVENSPGEIENLINLNILTLTKLCNLFGKDMAERGNGSILNVASMVALMPLPYFAIYSATKSYVLSLSISLRSELRNKGINVSCLLPGYVKTQFDVNAKITSERYKKFSQTIGMEASKVARIGIKALRKKKAVVIPGIINKILSVFVKIFPKTLIASLMKHQIENLTNT